MSRECFTWNNSNTFYLDVKKHIEALVCNFIIIN